MFVLDTNHLRELIHQTPAGLRLRERMLSPGEDVVLPIVAAEESLRGWLAWLASAKTPAAQQWIYAQFDQLLQELAKFIRLPWDRDAAARFAAFRAQGVRIGTLDLRIACITLEHDAMLLTRNAVDFAKVPGLRWENWLD